MSDGSDDDDSYLATALVQEGAHAGSGYYSNTRALAKPAEAVKSVPVHQQVVRDEQSSGCTWHLLSASLPATSTPWAQWCAAGRSAALQRCF